MSKEKLQLDEELVSGRVDLSASVAHVLRMKSSKVGISRLDCLSFAGKSF